MKRKSIELTIISELPDNLGKIPISPVIDFGQAIRDAGLDEVLDPNSIRVIDVADGSDVPHHRTEDFAYGDRGRVEFVVQEPSHKIFQIEFETCRIRPPLVPQKRVPLVGVGDLLRYNSGKPNPVTMYSMRYVDLNGSGRPDLCGTWNYYHRPGTPISGVICYPSNGGQPRFAVGDMERLRYHDSVDSTALHDFGGTYVNAEFADVNGDGLVDLIFAERNTGKLTFFLNHGEKSPTGMPVFVRDRTIETPKLDLGNMCVADVDGDGVWDIVIEGQFLRNTNPAGWPFEPAAPVDLGAGPSLAFLDLGENGLLDIFAFEPTESRFSDWPDGPGAYPGGSVSFRKRIPGSGLRFEAAVPVAGIPHSCTKMAAATGAGGPALLVQHSKHREIGLFECTGMQNNTPTFKAAGRFESPSAVIALTDQSWPCQCDWNDDGVQDLLVGGGYGWPRILINNGSNEEPAYAAPELVLSGDTPVRVTRDDILKSRHWHNLGYPYPAYVDWDGDGIPDLMLPNETNRIVWYKNEGTKKDPRFGPRQFIEVDGYPDSDAIRTASGRKGEDDSLPNHPYPRDPSSPFWWRSGAAFADWNGDGLMDVITHDEERKATLYVQYADDTGKLRLRKERHVLLTDGREIDDSIVGRKKHWTESFRAVDWNGNGLCDLIYNTAGSGFIYLLLNVGTKETPEFDLPRQMKCYGEPISFTVHGPNAWPGDWDGDGKPDLLGCVEWSVYPFYAHAALEMPVHPSYRVDALQQR